MTMKQNRSETETLTTAVSTAIEASQKLTDALRSIASIVSTGLQNKAVETTKKSLDFSSSGVPKQKTARTKKVSEAQDLGTATTIPKKKPGRPKKTELSTTSISPQQEKNLNSGREMPKPTEVEKQSTSLAELSPGNKRRGASPDVLKRARAMAALIRQRKKDDEAKVKEPVPIGEIMQPLSGWPFPSSTYYGNENERREEREVEDSNH